MTGPRIDFDKLKEVLASPVAATMPAALRDKMRSDVLAHDQSQMAIRPDASSVTNPMIQAQQHQTGIETATNESALGSVGGMGMQAIFQVGHDLSMGILPSAYGSDPATMTPLQRGGEVPIKIVSGIGTMVIQGAGLMRGLSFAGKVPIVARALEFLPGRLQEIGVGALVNGGIDAMRADGLNRQPNGAINDPSWLDPSAKIAKPLAELGIPDRVALGMGGAAVGGVVGPILMGIAAGFQAGRTSKLVTSMMANPALQESIKSGIAKAGIDLGTSAAKFDVAKVFITNFRKIHMGELEAGVMADQLSKEQYIANELAMGSAVNAQPLEAGQQIVPLTQEQGQLAAGIFRQNPGGVNVVHGISSTDAIDIAQQRLGVKLLHVAIDRSPEGLTKPTVKLADGTILTGDTHGQITDAAVANGLSTDGSELGYATNKQPHVEAAAAQQMSPNGIPGTDTFEPIQPTYDVLVGRPMYQYPEFSNKDVFGRLTGKITDSMANMAKKAALDIKSPRTTEAYILADGTPVRGGIDTPTLIEKMKLQKPMVNGEARGDLALREAGRLIRMDIGDEGKMTIDLPRTLSAEQFRAVGQAVDVMKFNEVTVRSFDGVEKSFQTPIGALIQDHIASVVPPASVGTTISPEMVQQFTKTGVFNGQAAILPDGTAAKILKKVTAGNGTSGYQVQEQLTGRTFMVHEKNLTVLPTALAGELQPSNLFASYMSDAERNALAKLRQSVQEGWATPITKYRDFESFANTRGYMANQLRGGKVELMKVNEGTGNALKFDSVPAAIEWVRKDSGPMAELGADDVNRLLGPDRNIGFIGGGGPAPRFNEMVPIDWERQRQTMETLPTDRGPGAFSNIFKPMLPYLRDLDQRFGTQMYKVAYNLQTQGVARDNFNALWYHGVDGRLSDGVMPLKKIIQLAGNHANQEVISDWLESADTISRTAIEARMKPNELRSAQELRKWYDAAYPALGINAPFVENYMPRYREYLQSGNAGSFQEFVQSVIDDPTKIPRGTDFVSDHIREGKIDAYNKNAFQVATQYLRAGARNRFMKTAQDEAAEMVRSVADKNVNLALPLANMTQAMGGYEFAEQRAMLNETFRGLLDKIPGGVAGKQAGLAEKLTDWSTSLVYASTMGFRPSLALRNAKDIFVMAYPIYAGPRFMEGVGRAMTQAGKEEAMAARAVSTYGGSMLNLNDQAVLDKLPEWLKKVQHASTALYDSADDFTRVGTYFAAKYKAEDALTEFGKAIDKGVSGSSLDNAITKLVRDSKMYMHGDDVKNEFLRLAGNSPDQAATYAGKVGSDMTNFIYGRGMQSRWMRSIGGRLAGQFGSWSMWYADYLWRTAKAAATPEFRGDALAILGRHAIINAGLLVAGKQVLDVDLSRWGSYGSLFFSGGPAIQLAMGAATLQRGLGDASSGGEDPLASVRIKSGSDMIWNTLPAFVPFFSAGRDVLRMAGTAQDWANDPSPANATDFLAATLGTRTTQDFQARRKVDILLGDYTQQPFASTSPALHTMLNNQASGRSLQPVDLRTHSGAGLQSTPGLPPIQAPQQTPAGTSITRSFDLKNRMPSPQLQNEVKSNSETKPTSNY